MLFLKIQIYLLFIFILNLFLVKKAKIVAFFSQK